MILDTSAIIAVLLRESEGPRLELQLGNADVIGVSAVTMVEVGIVLSARLQRDARGLLARFLDEVGIETIAFTNAHYGAAVDAWLRFGKGRHPAALNFGDCISYATAKLAGRPLLYVGEDFPKTDLSLI
jgi:ribonuclease VapC